MSQAQICRRSLAVVALTALVWGLLAAGAAAQGATGPVPEQGGPAAEPAGPRSAPSAPVMYRGREVFRVYAPTGDFTPEQRAEAVAERLDQIVNDQSVRPEDIKLDHHETWTDFVLRGEVIGTVTDADAAAAGVPRRVLAQRLLFMFRRIIVETRIEFSARNVAIGGAIAAVATLVFVVAVAIAWRLGRRLLGRLRNRLEHRTGSLRIQEAEIITAERWFSLTSAAVRVTRAALVIAISAAWAEIVMGALPWTQPYARRIVTYAAAPLEVLWDGLIGFLPDLFFLAAIALATWALLKLLRAVFAGIERETIHISGFDPDWARPTYSLVRVLVVAMSVVAAYPHIPGSSSSAFQSVGLFLGVLVSLASSSALSNVIAGTILTYTNAFKLGDRVAIGDTTGVIVAKSLLVTQVRTPKDVVVSVPNGLVLGGQILNYSRLATRGGVILHTEITIGYDAPWRTVHALLIEAARHTEGVLEEPAPFVLQTALNDFYVSYQINAFTVAPEDMEATYGRLHANIQDAFNRGGVEIMSPHYASLRDGNTTTIPADHRPAGYEAPAFTVASRPPAGARQPGLPTGDASPGLPPEPVRR